MKVKRDRRGNWVCVRDLAEPDPYGTVTRARALHRLRVPKDASREEAEEEARRWSDEVEAERKGGRDAL